MSLFNVFKNSNNNKKIIYVLDRLIQIAIDGEAINKSRNIDVDLYKLLNDPIVNQEIIHVGLLPIANDNKSASDEFVSFIESVWKYMVYDIDKDYFFVMTLNKPDVQKKLYEMLVSSRTEILQYLQNKKMISNEQFASAVNYKIKNLSD